MRNLRLSNKDVELIESALEFVHDIKQHELNRLKKVISPAARKELLDSANVNFKLAKDIKEGIKDI